MPLSGLVIKWPLHPSAIKRECLLVRSADASRSLIGSPPARPLMKNHADCLCLWWSHRGLRTRLQTCELEVRLLNNGNKKRSREQIRRRGRAFTCLFHYFCVSFDLVRVYWAGTRVYLAMLNFDTVILLHLKLAIEEPASKRARISKVWELPQWVVAFMRLNLETLALNTC